MGLLASGSPDSVYGAMQVFTEFIKTDLTEDQILPVLRQLLPVLLNIVGAAQVIHRIVETIRTGSTDSKHNLAAICGIITSTRNRGVQTMR